MTLISIEGMDENSILNQDIKPTGGGLHPFPCDGSGWTNQTGVVLKCELKTLTGLDGAANDNISITVGNGEYGGEILVGLDWKQTAPGVADVSKAQQQNLDTLMKCVKVLGCHTRGQIDTAKLDKAHGMCIEFICKHKGFSKPNAEGRQFHKIGYIFKGGIDDMRPVTEVSMPAIPGSANAREKSVTKSSDDSDVPF